MAREVIVYGAGLTLRAIESNGVWAVREVKKASCPIGRHPGGRQR